MSSVFVYGSLLAPEVLRALLGRVPPAKAATLHGHRRYSIRERTYPATVKASDADAVQGRVLLDLSSKEKRLLDLFEARRQLVRESPTRVLG